MSVEIGRWILQPIPIPGTPIVLVPVLILKVGLDGLASAGVTVGSQLTSDVLAGIACGDETCTTVGDFDFDGELNQVQFTTGGTLEAYLRASLDVSLNALVGGNFGVKTFVEAEVSPLSDPWWSIYGGVKAGAGVTALLGVVELGYRDFVTLRRLIASAPPGAPKPLAGSWSGTITDNQPATNAIQMQLTQSGTTISGSVSVNGQTLSGSGSVTSSVSGTTFTGTAALTQTGSACIVTFAFTLQLSGNSLSGTFTDGRNSCVQNVTWTGTISMSRTGAAGVSALARPPADRLRR